MRLEKAMAVMCISLGSVLIYMAGSDIYYSAGMAALLAYTVAVLIVGAGIRAVLKS